MTPDVREKAVEAMARAGELACKSDMGWTAEQFETWWNRDWFFCEQVTSWGYFTGTRKAHTLFLAAAALDAAYPIIRDTVERDGWRPIETAPKDGTEILAYGSGVLLRDGRTSIYAPAQHVMWWQAGEDHSFWATRDPEVIGGRPTHWRPLPAPPADGGGDGQG